MSVRQLALVVLLAACAETASAGPSSRKAEAAPAPSATAPSSGLHGTRPPTPASLPEFTAVNADGQQRHRADLIGRPTVLWFYPMTNTPGCTKEGCNYRDLQAEFDQLGVRIVAVSFGTPAQNTSWIDDQKYRFEVWQDADKTLAVHFGAAQASSMVPKRITKVLDAQGNLVLEYVDGVDVGTHPADVLDDCKALFTKP